MAVGQARAQVAAIYDGLGEPHSGKGYLWQCQGEKMIDHIILTVSDVERSLAFYEASLAPIDIRFFLPYKGENGHPHLWGFGDGKRAFFWLKQGEPDPRAIHWEPVRAANGTVLYWIGVNLDIEERKQAEFYLAEGQRLAHIGSWAFTPAGRMEGANNDIQLLKPADLEPRAEYGSTSSDQSI
jgi:catechol 2,3-dioxygenase-like lactoylglutathione lyase family enzyme